MITGTSHRFHRTIAYVDVFFVRLVWLRSNIFLGSSLCVAAMSYTSPTPLGAARRGLHGAYRLVQFSCTGCRPPSGPVIGRWRLLVCLNRFLIGCYSVAMGAVGRLCCRRDFLPSGGRVFEVVLARRVSASYGSSVWPYFYLPSGGRELEVALARKSLLRSLIGVVAPSLVLDQLR